VADFRLQAGKASNKAGTLVGGATPGHVARTTRTSDKHLSILMFARIKTFFGH
jgi:hypothetical protein